MNFSAYCEEILAFAGDECVLEFSTIDSESGGWCLVVTSDGIPVLRQSAKTAKSAALLLAHRIQVHLDRRVAA